MPTQKTEAQVCSTIIPVAQKQEASAHVGLWAQPEEDSSPVPGTALLLHGGHIALLLENRS